MGSRMQQAILATCLLAIVGLQISMPSSAEAFPSLFNRPRLFQRQQQSSIIQQQQQQQQQPANIQTNQQHQEPLLLNANSMAPVFGAQFGLSNDDLLRIQQQQHHHLSQQQKLVPSQQIEHNELNSFGGPVNFDAQAAAYFKPTIITDQHHSKPLSSFGNVQPINQHQDQDNNMAAALSDKPVRLAPSQSQMVDKIEQHLEQNLEEAFNMVGASGINGHKAHQQAAAASSAESSASEEAGQEEVAGASGGESTKQAEHEQEPSEHHHQEHQEHQHEHPPEAFEVHHKKGGKSYQYFHQGHHP